MLLKQARNNRPFAVILIPLVIIFVWFNPIHHAIQPNVGNHLAMPLQNLMQKIVVPCTLTSRIVGLVLLLLVSLYINRLNTKFIFISERTYLPAAFYLLLCTGLLPYNDFTPILPSVLLFLYAFERLLISYKTEKLSYNSFDASLLIGLASLFYFNFIFFLVFIWASLSVLRPFNWREWLYSVLGLVVPYFILWSIYYLLDKDINMVFAAIRENLSIYITVSLTKVQYLFGGIIVLLIILSGVHLLGNLGNMKILSRRSFNLFIILLLICLGIFFIVKSSTLEFIYIAAIPMSMLFSNYFLTAHKTRWLEVIFDFFIISFLLTQFLVL